VPQVSGLDHYRLLAAWQEIRPYMPCATSLGQHQTRRHPTNLLRFRQLGDHNFSLLTRLQSAESNETVEKPFSGEDSALKAGKSSLQLAFSPGGTP
jgi:hypothetical protein